MSVEGSPCAVCGEERPEAFRVYFDAYLKLYRCTTCGFVAQYPGPGRRSAIDDSKRRLALPEGQQWQYPQRDAVLKDIAIRVGCRRPGRGDWLDVGCGDGHFLAICKELGFSVTGVEPSACLARYAATVASADVRCGYYDRSLFAEQSFDVISFVQVLEHLAHPKPVLQAAWNHLRPGGMVVIEVPSIHAPHFLAYRLTGIEWFVKPPTGVITTHQGYYRPRTLVTLVTGIGFSIVELTTGRWRVKYGGLISSMARLTDPLFDILRIGGILLIGRK